MSSVYWFFSSPEVPEFATQNFKDIAFKTFPCNSGDALCEERAVSIDISVYLFWRLPLLFPVSRVTLGLCEISGFRREAHENCALLGCYAASSGSFLPTFWDQRSGIPFPKRRLQVTTIRCVITQKSGVLSPRIVLCLL